MAVSTERFDREVKGPRYAAAGIPEVWIVLPERGRVERYWQPEGGQYVRVENVTREGTVPVDALPAWAPVVVADVLR